MQIFSSASCVQQHTIPKSCLNQIYIAAHRWIDKLCFPEFKLNYIILDMKQCKNNYVTNYYWVADQAKLKQTY